MARPAVEAFKPVGTEEIPLTLDHVGGSARLPQCRDVIDIHAQINRIGQEFFPSMYGQTSFADLVFIPGFRSGAAHSIAVQLDEHLAAL